MIYIRKIKKLCEKRKIGIKDLALKIDMSPSGFYSALNENSLRVDKLLLIAEFFEKPIFYFFDEDPPINIISEPDIKYKRKILCPECELRERIIEKQQVTIEAQKKTIDCLERKGGALPVGSVGKTGTK